MITDEQILEIAREHLEEFDFDTDGPDCAFSDYHATREQLIAFAQEIYEMGNVNGWESRAESEYLCSSAPFVGDDE